MNRGSRHMYNPAQIMSFREVIIFLVLTMDFWNYFLSKKNLSSPATNKYNFTTHTIVKFTSNIVFILKKKNMLKLLYGIESERERENI